MACNQYPDFFEFNCAMSCLTDLPVHSITMEDTPLSQEVTASIVLFNQTAQDVAPLFKELAKDTALLEWVVVDNGGSEEACVLAVSLGGRCIKASGNIGFGAGHNLALRSLTADTPYHLILIQISS